MSQDCQNVFCNNVLVTNTKKSKGEDEIDFNVVFPICEFIYSSMHITFKTKYFAQNYFVQVLYIWAKDDAFPSS
jgi:hypothetical protein